VAERNPEASALNQPICAFLTLSAPVVTPRASVSWLRANFRRAGDPKTV
jgi:hypothetical protein